MEQSSINYFRIAEAIGYIYQNFKNQPDLDDIARKINLSPYHFQRLFTEWAGVSPKKFLQYISLEYAKGLLRQKHLSLSETAFQTGLSGTGRLHDLFITIEGMTPGEFKNGGENLTINYSFADTPFGKILVASTQKGVCYLSFIEEEDLSIKKLKKLFENARFINTTDDFQQNSLHFFRQDWSNLTRIKLHVKGTGFQLKVWETLLKIPVGALSTYKDVASDVNTNGVRAVGTAIGCNPVAFLIPCHRVIQSAGTFGKYHWGIARKTAMIGWEAAIVNDFRCI